MYVKVSSTEESDCMSESQEDDGGDGSVCSSEEEAEDWWSVSQTASKKLQPLQEKRRL
jgi:hypothetical protein